METIVSVFCIWRDSEENILRTLKQLEDLEKLSTFSFSYFFYENDSKDKTREILENWMKKRLGVFLSEDLNEVKFGSTTDPQRMKLLCECRNKCKNLAGENNSNISLIIDSDIKFDTDNFLMQISDLNKLDSAVMITANVRQNIKDLVFNESEDSYYDVYAFRDEHGTNGMYFSDCPSYKSSDQKSWSEGRPIITMSSFGGFAVLKSEVFNKVRWYSDIHCDHVNMCFDISKHGRIYCEPKSKVYVEIDLSNLNLDSCKQIGIQQRQKYEQFFKT